MLGIVMTTSSLLVGLLLFWFFVPAGDSFGLFEGVSNPTTRLVLTFLAVIAGVLLGSLYRELSTLRQKGIPKIQSFRTFLADMSRSIDLWLGIVGSPLVFALLLNTAKGMTLGGMMITGLQNGFCCLLVLNRLIDRPPPQPRAKRVTS